MMRRRQGRAAVSRADSGDKGSRVSLDPECNQDVKENESLATRGDSEKETKERVFSWFDVVRAGAQLTLDLLRVIRETSDLYRKVSGGKSGTGS